MLGAGARLLRFTSSARSPRVLRPARWRITSRARGNPRSSSTTASARAVGDVRSQCSVFGKARTPNGCRREGAESALALVDLRVPLQLVVSVKQLAPAPGVTAQTGQCICGPRLQRKITLLMSEEARGLLGLRL